MKISEKNLIFWKFLKFYFFRKTRYFEKFRKYSKSQSRIVFLLLNLTTIVNFNDFLRKTQDFPKFCDFWMTISLRLLGIRGRAAPESNVLASCRSPRCWLITARPSLIRHRVFFNWPPKAISVCPAEKPDGNGKLAGAYPRARRSSAQGEGREADLFKGVFRGIMIWTPQFTVLPQKSS